MSQLALNGKNTTIDPGFQTWKELLADLESRRLADDEVITSVHFDGDEMLRFRGDEVLSLQLNSVREIRVEAMAKAEMLRGAVREAEGYLASLQGSMLDIAEKFRSGRADQANSELQQLFEGIKMFIALLRGMELSLSGTEKSGVEKALEQMGVTLQDQIKAQTQQDWMLLADILEYELTADLNAFGDVLAGFKSPLGLS